MDVDVTVIGAGAVGLACAGELAARGSLLILEKEDGIGRGISSRNSEIVHAGIHYAPGSLKARLCVEGRRQIEAWAKKDAFAYRRTAKLIVAVERDEEPILERLLANGRQNSVEQLALMPGRVLHNLEPDVRAVAALHSLATGTLDSHDFLRFLLRRAEELGARLATHSNVDAIEKIEGGYRLTVTNRGQIETLTSRCLVNAAGLYSDSIAALCGLDVESSGLLHRWCRGEYFRIRDDAKISVSRPIYPVPHPGGHLGVHVTVDLRGQLRLGPTHDYLEELPLPERSEQLYQDDRLREPVHAAARRFLPGLKPDDLEPSGVGIRPRLNREGEPARDFYIEEQGAAGLPGLVHCLGIDSPGLTAAPAIGRHVVKLLDPHLDPAVSA